jgi:transcriptional regulator GlxA family with amidase domain
VPRQLELGISKRVYLVVRPGFRFAHLGVALETLRTANEIGGAALYQVAVISESAPDVLSEEGIRVVAQATMRDAPNPYAILLLLARTDIGSIDKDSPLSRWLGHRAREGVFVRALAPSSRPYPATDRQSGPEGGDQDKTEAAVDHRPGIDTLVPLAELIGHDQGSAFARSVTERLAASAHSSIGQPDRRLDELSPRLRAALSVMHGNLEKALRCSEIARRIGVSARHLERLFQAHCGASPRSHYLRARLDYARKLVRHSAMTEQAIALALGFSSVGHFRRRYRRQFGVSPSEDRAPP